MNEKEEYNELTEKVIRIMRRPKSNYNLNKLFKQYQNDILGTGEEEKRIKEEKRIDEKNKQKRKRKQRRR